MDAFFVLLPVELAVDNLKHWSLYNIKWLQMFRLKGGKRKISYMVCKWLAHIRCRTWFRGAAGDPLPHSLAHNQQDSTLPLINEKPLKKINHHNHFDRLFP